MLKEFSLKTSIIIFSARKTSLHSEKIPSITFTRNPSIFAPDLSIFSNLLNVVALFAGSIFTPDRLDSLNYCVSNIHCYTENARPASHPAEPTCPQREHPECPRASCNNKRRGRISSSPGARRADRETRSARASSAKAPSSSSATTKHPRSRGPTSGERQHRKSESRKSSARTIMARGREGGALNCRGPSLRTSSSSSARARSLRASRARV